MADKPNGASLIEKDRSDRYVFSMKPEPDVIKGHSTRRVEEECKYMLPAFLAKVQDQPTLKVLDVGCGPGSITIGLAKLAPQGQVTGVDLSETLLEHARNDAKSQGISNITFTKADAYTLPFPDGSIDVLHTHQAVLHLHEQVRAIREFLRVLKNPGGLLCMREGLPDSMRCYPPYPLLEEFARAFEKLQHSYGGVCDTGLRLKAWAIEAGVPREKITATASAWCFDTREEREKYGGTWPGRLEKGAYPEGLMRLGFTK
jgi:SAM-dependent methyltransferase